MTATTKRAGRPVEAGTGQTVRRYVTIDPATEAAMRLLGAGNLSRGIREAARRMRRLPPTG